MSYDTWGESWSDAWGTSWVVTASPTRLAGTWDEPTRGILWDEDTRPLTWDSEMQTLVARLSETADYAYDFHNDAVISAGDAIASVVSVTPIARTNGAVLPTVGTPTVVGTKVVVRITATDENSGYFMRFVVTTVSGLTRIGVGIYEVEDTI